MSMVRTRTFSLFDVNAVTEAGARHASDLAAPRRRVGKATVPRKMGVKMRDRLIRSLTEAGMSVVQISAAVGRSEKTVYRRLAALDIEPPRRRRTGS